MGVTCVQSIIGAVVSAFVAIAYAAPQPPAKQANSDPVLPAPMLGLNCVTPGSTETSKAPCSVEGSELKFAILGDWGGKSSTTGNTKVNENVATTIKKLAENNGLHFVLNVGDNFYPYLRPNKPVVEQFQKVFHSNFPAKEINLPFYSMFGNHDYVNVNGIKEQIDYTNNPLSGKRWILPERYYTMNFQLTQNKKLIKFIVVDTQLLCGALIKIGKSSWRPIGREHMTPPQLKDSIKHEAWILEEIKKGSSAHHLFVVGHYHVHTIRTIYPAIECMKTVLSDKLLAEQHVTAYISGHEHLLQHWEVTSAGHKIHHVLSGEGYNIYPITKEDVATHKTDIAGGFFHGRLEDPNNAPTQFMNPNNDAPGVVVVTAGATEALFKYIDNPIAPNALHSFKVLAREVSASHKGPELKATDAQLAFKETKSIDTGNCQAEWKALAKGKQSKVYTQETVGHIGCIEKSTPPSTEKEAIFHLGANRMKLSEKTAFEEGKPQKYGEIHPIWTCWRCIHEEGFAGNNGYHLIQAFCHVGKNPQSDKGHLAYDRYIRMDGYRYMCNGLENKARNAYEKGVMTTVPLFEKKQQYMDDKIRPVKEEVDGFVTWWTDYFLSEDAGFTKE